MRVAGLGARDDAGRFVAGVPESIRGLGRDAHEPALADDARRAADHELDDAFFHEKHHLAEAIPADSGLRHWRQVMDIQLALPGGWYSNICSHDAV